MKKLLLLLLLIPNLVMADNFTDETLDLMLDCKGDGYLHHYGDKTYTPISSNETLHIKTDKYGRYLAEVSYKKENINDWLLNNQYAMRYDGKTKTFFDSRNYNSNLAEDVAVAISIDESINRNSFNRVSINTDKNGEFVID